MGRIIDTPEHLQRPKVEHIADCEDCGATDVVNRKVFFRSRKTPYQHWQVSCNCGCERHPPTGEFIHRNSTQMREFYKTKFPEKPDKDAK